MEAKGGAFAGGAAPGPPPLPDLAFAFLLFLHIAVKGASIPADTTIERYTQIKGPLPLAIRAELEGPEAAAVAGAEDCGAVPARGDASACARLTMAAAGLADLAPVARAAFSAKLVIKSEAAAAALVCGAEPSPRGAARRGAARRRAQSLCYARVLWPANVMLTAPEP